MPSELRITCDNCGGLLTQETQTTRLLALRDEVKLSPLGRAIPDILLPHDCFFCNLHCLRNWLLNRKDGR